MKKSRILGTLLVLTFGPVAALILSHCGSGNTATVQVKMEQVN